MSIIYVNPYKFAAAGPAFLLDNYSGAAAAYSLRQLRTGVTNVVRVRRDNDDAEDDFTATDVDDGTLVAWVGAGNNGYVTTWYDQSGNGNHCQPSATINDLFLISAGTLTTTNSKPAISRLFGAGGLTSSLLQLGFPFSALFVLYPDYANLSSTVRFAGHYTSGQMRFGTNNLNGYFGATVNGPTTSGRQQQLLSYISPSSSLISTAVNDSALINNSGSFSISASDFSLLGLSGGSFIGTMQEVIIFSRDITADFSGIKANINAHYSIYP